MKKLPRANLIFKNVFGKRPGLMPGFPNTMLPLKDDGLVESIVELFLKKMPFLFSKMTTFAVPAGNRNALRPVPDCPQTFKST